MLTEPPVLLPVGHLSVSSVRRFLRSPEQWRRRYLAGDPEPTSAWQLLGTCVHATESHAYQHLIDDRRPLAIKDVLARFSQEWDWRITDQPGGLEWEDEKPGRIKDIGVRLLRGYHQHIVPLIRPVNVERKYNLTFEGLGWTFEGYLDLEVEHQGGTAVDDLKTSKAPIRPAEAASDLQVTANLFARRAEGNPATGFRFHNLVRPTVTRDGVTRLREPRPSDFLVTPAWRSPMELDAFHELLFRVAAQIKQAAETDTWLPAPPGSWWCAENTCSYWSTCAYGGGGRSALYVPEPPRPLRAPSDAAILEAVDATVTKTGLKCTTAEKVAGYLGIGPRSAAARMTALARHGLLESERPTKGVGRGKERRVVAVAGPNVYRRCLPLTQDQAA